MGWIYLLIAGIFEITWAVGLKISQGFTKPLASVVTAITMLLSVLFLAKAMKTLPLGTSYAIWTGIGAIGTALVGLLYFGEPRDVGRIVCLLMIVAGVVGLKFVS